MKKSNLFYLAAVVVALFVVSSGCVEESGYHSTVTSGGGLGGSSWASWTPTLTWTGGAPAAPIVVSRYTQVGKVVFFTIDISSADANGATGLSTTLPVNPANTGNRIPVNVIQINGD